MMMMMMTVAMVVVLERGGEGRGAGIMSHIM